MVDNQIRRIQPALTLLQLQLEHPQDAPWKPEAAQMALSSGEPDQTVNSPRAQEADLRFKNEILGQDLLHIMHFSTDQHIEQLHDYFRQSLHLKHLKSDQCILVLMQ